MHSTRFRLIWLAVLVCGTAFAAVGIKPLTAILFAQAANGFLLPICAIFLLIIMNRSEILGTHVNKRWANLAGVVVVGVTLLLGLLKILQVMGFTL